MQAVLCVQCSPLLGSNISQGNISSQKDRVPNHKGDTIYYVLNVGASIILLVVICCGNSLILYLAVKHRNQQSSSVNNLLIAAMSLHDLTTGVVVTPMHIINILELEELTEMQCLALNVFTFAVHIVSGYTPLLLSLDRFMAIIFPFRYSALVTEKKVYISLCLIWLYGILVGCMPLMGWNDLDRDHPINFCHVEHFVDGRYLGFIYLGNVVPCMIGQIALYTKIILTARNQARRIGIENSRNVNVNSAVRGAAVQKPEKRGLLILALTSVFFTVSYMPMILETAIDFNLYTSKSLQGSIWSTELFYIGDIIILTNAAINPVFYAYSRRDFRIKIKQMFTRTQSG